jgi:hypothetical protein
LDLKAIQRDHTGTNDLSIELSTIKRKIRMLLLDLHYYSHNLRQFKFITLTNIMPKKETKAPPAGKETKVPPVNATKEKEVKPVEKPQGKK